MEQDRKETRRVSMAVLASISALRGAFHNMRHVVWQPFVLSLGVPMRSLGGLESILDLSRILVQPIVGGASDAQGRRRWLVLQAALGLAIGVLTIFTGSWPLLLVIVVLLGFEGSLYNVWTALVADSFEADRLGRTYSVLTACTTAAGLIASLSAGFIAESYGFRVVFIISTVFAFIGFLIVLFRLPETVKRTLDSGYSIRNVYRSLVDTLKPPPELRGFYIAMALDLFAFGMGYRLISGMLTRGYGYTPQMLGIMATVMTASMTVAQIPAGMFIERVGYAKYLALSQLLACIYLGLVVYSKQFEVVLLAQVLNGISAAVWGPAERAWIAGNVGIEERARALGSYSTVRALLSFPAPFIGGVLFDSYGLDVPVLLNIALALVDIVLILTLIKDRGD
ncbi:MAG: MFS transporter [Candidatus Bathyarchaeota archaeon]|nr:MAG: MFS transporter [Candidatus Bathyarchaeota archaeon]